MQAAMPTRRPMRAKRATRDSRHAKQTTGAHRSDHVDAPKALDRDEKNRRFIYEACAASAVRDNADPRRAST
jgi:hypothetical protein